MNIRLLTHRAGQSPILIGARGNLPLLAALVTITIVGLLLNREVYAIGDDYHFFGFYFALGGMDYAQAAFSFWSSPFAAGRPFAPVFDLIPLSLMHSISQFEWVRMLHLVLLITICIQIYKVASSAGRHPKIGGLISLCIFSMPGIWHVYMVSYGTSMLIGVSAALAGAVLIASTHSPSIKRWFVFVVIAVVVIFTYQPLWPILFIGVTVRILSVEIVNKRKDADLHIVTEQLLGYATTYLRVAAVVACVFVLNYLLVRYGYNSPRLSSGPELVAKVHHILIELVPATIYPWLYLFFPGRSWVIVLSWATVVLSFFLILRMSYRSPYSAAGRQIGFRYVFRLALIILIATSLLPLSLGMYVFTDQAVGFRRVVFASIYFWFVFLYVLNRAVPRLAIYKPARYGLYGGFTMVALIVGVFLDVSTQQLAATEWKSALCATRHSPISDQTRIDRSAVLLPIPFPSALQNDEVQVRTLSYPTGAMLIWLSHSEALGKRPAFSPWVLEIADQPALGAWERAYKQCSPVSN